MAKKSERQEEMTPEEAREYRAAQFKPAPRSLTLEERREAFRVFWAKEKIKYGKSKDLEQVIWVHLKAVKMDSPEQFEAGIQHFGLKKIGK